MKTIPLTKGKFAIVDNKDFTWLSKFKWFATNLGMPNNWYAGRAIRINGKAHTVLMHRAILNTPTGVQVDHRNGNGLDNRRRNIRESTQQQNCFNRGRATNNTSGFKGVFRYDAKSWRARVSTQKKNGKVKWGPLRHDRELAAKDYDKLAVKWFGKFARLNFPTKANPIKA